MITIDRKEVKRILLITLTNIGDIILTTPVIAALDKAFPSARIDVMVGPLGRDIFIDHPTLFHYDIGHCCEIFIHKFC